MDPSYSRRLRQMTRSEWELTRGRIRLNTPGDHVYDTRILNDAYYYTYRSEMCGRGREQG